MVDVLLQHDPPYAQLSHVDFLPETNSLYNHKAFPPIGLATLSGIRRPAGEIKNFHEFRREDQENGAGWRDMARPTVKAEFGHFLPSRREAELTRWFTVDNWSDVGQPEQVPSAMSHAREWWLYRGSERLLSDNDNDEFTIAVGR